MGITVFSAFDGMAGGMQALDRLGIEVDTYIASEIDKQAMIVALDNYPDIIEVGDVTKVSYEDGVLYTEKGTYDVGTIHLVLGGSPCQTFSSAGSRTGFEGKSGLYWEFSRLLKEIQPEDWLLENVVMKKEWRAVIDEDLGVEPVAINSNLVSAQSRPRLYWSSVESMKLPEDRGITFHDIAEFPGFPAAKRGRRIDPITGTKGDVNRDIPICQYVEPRADSKTNCLTTVDKDNVIVQEKLTRRIQATEIEHRSLTRLEKERLQTVTPGYTKSVSTHQAGRMLGNGWTIDVIVHILSHMNLERHYD
jgi:DNA (cytosine-5)-methyltransferase 3A